MYNFNNEAQSSDTTSTVDIYAIIGTVEIYEGYAN